MLKLLPFQDPQIDQLIAWASSPDLLFNWMGSSVPYPLSAETIHQLHQESKLNPPTLFVYTAWVDNEPAGHIELGRLNSLNAYARIERVFVPQQGRGYGTEMVRAILPIAFKELQLNRLELLVFEENKGAICCYEKAGFRTEGTMREARRKGDRFVDLRIMSMIASDWRL